MLFCSLEPTIKNIYFFFISWGLFAIGILPEGIFVYHMNTVPMEPAKGIISPRTEISHGCKLPCGRWELGQGPLEEVTVLSSAEPSSF